MAKSNIPVSVIFNACGAEQHPSFAGSQRLADGTYCLLDFPIGNPRYRQSRKAQLEWADGKVKHLKSWGTKANPRIVE